MIVTLQCYQCGSEYDYIGTSPHPGECQICGSHCVPPAGTLSVVDTSHWESANGLSKVWVSALDERDRFFKFEVAAHNGRGKLVGVHVNEVSVHPQVDTNLMNLPPTVMAALAEEGIEQVETGQVRQRKK